MRSLCLSLVVAGLAFGWVAGCQGPSDRLPPISDPPAILRPISDWPNSVDWPDRVPGAGEDDGEKEPGDAIPTGTGGGTGGVAQSGPPQSLDAGAAPSADSDSMAPAQDAGVAPDAAELDAGDASSEAATRS